MKVNKSVKTNLTSETLKPAGIETERKNEDDLTEENEIFLQKGWFFPGHHTRDLHHTSIGFFLDSFKNMNISELFRVSKSEFHFDHLQESMQIL